MDKLLMVFVLLCAGCTAVTMPTKFAVLDGVIYIDGDISKESARKFLDLVSKTSLQKVVIVNSLGGDVDASLDIANYMHENNVDIEVQGLCFSSCANYLFPAAAHKEITKNGLVAWHGNVAHMVELMKNEGEHVLYRLAFKGTVDREAEFFLRVGVSPRLSRFGKEQPYSSEYFYYIDAEDMRYFGIKNLKVRENYDTSGLVGEYEALKPYVTYVKVDRSITIPSARN